MDQQAYEKWWALHLRVALGQTLGEAEHARYTAGLAELDATDDLRHADQGIAQARTALAALNAENARLRAGTSNSMPRLPFSKGLSTINRGRCAAT